MRKTAGFTWCFRQMLFQLSHFLAICEFLRYGSVCSAKQTYSEGGPRSRFESTFDKTCSKYPFVSQYLANLEAPAQRFIIFVFDERGVKNGGLGDRLGGMITAIAFALRTRRTLLISADKAFEAAFTPYHPNNNGSYLWGNWGWSGYLDEYNHGGNIIQLRNCVNSRNTKCCLDDDVKEKVVRYISNRAYLCRWVVKPDLYNNSNLERLGITADTDLFEAAGCMLRLAMWPTEIFWNSIDNSMENQLKSLNNQFSITSYQLGFHFRCGDKSFGNDATLMNPECYFDSSIPWVGTNFLDDMSMESPQDLGVCGAKILKNLKNSNPELSKHAMVYIASDNHYSAQQINTTINYPIVFLPPKVCHVEMNAKFECTVSTLLHWFILSLSDRIVMQTLIPPDYNHTYYNPDMHHHNSQAQSALSKYGVLPSNSGLVSLNSGHLDQNFSAPISAFSRFAVIYSLHNNAAVFGLSCNNGSKTAMSKHTQGNWLCDPSHLF